MTAEETCQVLVYPPGQFVGHRCGRKVKREVCGLHLAAQERREAKREAARREQAQRRQYQEEQQRRQTLALNLAQFLTDALRVQFEAAYGGVWMDTDQAEALLRIAQAKLL